MVKNIWFKISLTMRTALVMLAIITGGITLMLGAKVAFAASLKPVSVIEGDVLTLGDIFDGITTNADYVIGPAPQPGQDMVLNARTLYRIAIAMDLPWRPTSSADQITIRREATVIPYEAIENTLRGSLSEKGVNGNYNLALNNGKPSIVLPQNLPEEIEIKTFTYNHQRDTFKATLVAPSQDNPVKKLSVTGKVERMIQVPILKNNLQNGMVIGENDIDFINVPQKTLQHNVITSKEELIGMTPRRMAYAGKFVLDGTLQKPQLVERGDKVTITFFEGPLELTAKGTALQSGAKGDLIRVKNINSSRMVDAFVSGSNQVVVR